jgi:hypothetical protein
VILKVQGSDDSWTFYDNVSNPVVRLIQATPETPHELDVHTIHWHGPSDDFWQEKGQSTALVRISYEAADGHVHAVVAWPHRAYLLNDNGKTIERL